MENTQETTIENEEIQTVDDSASEPQEKDNKKKHNYKDGQVLRFIRVRFPGHARSYPFLIGKRSFQYGQKVVALSDRGMAVGYINSFPYEVEFNESLLPVRTIAKVAHDDDGELPKDQESKEKEYEDLCKKLIKRHELEMNLTHVEMTAYGKKCVFYFTAPARVDFRGLVKDLVAELKMRIELRQISARERAAALGGLGPCGKELCCSTFLSRYGNVNIKMAKTQNLTLVPAKLNGLCGQLKCCTQFEEDVYSEKRKRLPREGSFLKTANGDIGKITQLHILIEQFDMLTDQGVIKRYDQSQFDKQNCEPPNGWKFPERFQHISRETSTIIGKKEEVYISNQFMNDDNELGEQEITEVSFNLDLANEVSSNEPDKDKKRESRDRRNRRNRRQKPNNKHKKSANKNDPFRRKNRSQSKDNNNKKGRPSDKKD